MVYLNKAKTYLENYESISKGVKYVSNSVVRLKILALLFERPQNMKELNDRTSLSYSSISSNMHGLELEGYVYRESNKYFLSNTAKLQIENILELNRTIILLNEFFNILDRHIVHMIPNESVLELFLLGKASLLESNDLDVYRTYNFIEKSLTLANSAKCIFPFYYESFNNKLNDLVEDNKNVEVIVSQKVFDMFCEDSKIENLSSFKGRHNFLLICTDDVMILGLFKDDGNFDQNRLLVSKNNECLKWANNLFENFKKENK